jgi:hypothetical protein
MERPVEPTSVRIGMMDSRRPGVVTVLQARHLTRAQRLARALRRFVVAALLSVVVLNVLLLFVPVPVLHLCTLPAAVLVAPILTVVTFRQTVLLAACEVPCPRCGEPVAFPADFPGWPARRNCLGCGIMVELDLARPMSGEPR